MLVGLVVRFKVNRFIQPKQHLLGLMMVLCSFGPTLYAQVGLSVPDEITFANVPIHLTTQTRQYIQRELTHLYSSPHQRQADREALRRLSPLLKPFLQKASLPDDFCLIALPFQDTDSLGYWGLPTTQARQLNLRLDKLVDERYHPLNSTEAVMAKIQSWQNRPNPLIALLRYLEWADQGTRQQPIDRNYVQPDEQSPPILWKLLARKVALTTQSSVPQPATDSLAYVYQPAGGQTLQEIAQRLPVTLDQLRTHNRWLKSDLVPADKDYSVIVPLTPDEFIQANKLVESGPNVPSLAGTGFPILAKAPPKSDPLRKAAQYYRINQREGIQAQNCDNLITLAFYGQVSIPTFLKYNDLPNEQVVIRPGQIYYLQAKARRAMVPFHVMQPNQTLLEVANQYGIRLKSVLTFNRLQAVHRLPTGRLLWLQKKRPARQPIMYIKLPEPPIRTTPSQTAAPDSIVASQPRIPEKNTLVALDSLLRPFGDSSSVDRVPPTAVVTSNDTLSLPQTPSIALPQPSRRHAVKAGQTYYSIARLYRVSVDQLYRWNHVSAAIPLRIGQSLLIQEEGAPPQVVKRLTAGSAWHRSAPIHKVVSQPVLRKAVFYTVQAGQTLYRIALMYRVRVKDLVSWNDLKNIVLETGQILLIWQ